MNFLKSKDYKRSPTDNVKFAFIPARKVKTTQIQKSHFANTPRIMTIFPVLKAEINKQKIK